MTLEVSPVNYYGDIVAATREFAHEPAAGCRAVEAAEPLGSLFAIILG
jgi:hypothetical protein